MSIIPGINVTASALQAQKLRLEVAAQNIANANTTRGPNGGPYQRQIVSFATELFKQESMDAGNAMQGVRVASVKADPKPGISVYSPGHPDADAKGMVRMPNVQMAMEMVDMMSASRSYEANLVAAKTSREMALRTLEIGR